MNFYDPDGIKGLYEEIYSTKNTGSVYLTEGLVGNQEKIDANDNGKIDSDDFVRLRKQKELNRLKLAAKKPSDQSDIAKEELDIFDTVLEFLCVEGYAETLEDAEWIMSNQLDAEDINAIVEAKVGPDEKLPSGKTPVQKMQNAQGRHGANYMLAKGDVRYPGAKNAYHTRARKVKQIKDIVTSGGDPRDDSSVGVGWGHDARKVGRPGVSTADRTSQTKRTGDNDAKTTYTQGGLRAHKTKAGGYRTLKRN